jgi:hypothetical protein
VSWRHPFIGLGLIVAGMAFHSLLLMVLLRLGTPHTLVQLFQGYPRLQILSIQELLEDGKKPQLPPFVMPTYQQAEPINREKAGEQGEMFGTG